MELKAEGVMITQHTTVFIDPFFMNGSSEPAEPADPAGLEAAGRVSRKSFFLGERQVSNVA